MLWPRAAGNGLRSSRSRAACAGCCMRCGAMASTFARPACRRPPEEPTANDRGRRADSWSQSAVAPLTARESRCPRTRLAPPFLILRDSDPVHHNAHRRLTQLAQRPAAKTDVADGNILTTTRRFIEAKRGERGVPPERSEGPTGVAGPTPNAVRRPTQNASNGPTRRVPPRSGPTRSVLPTRVGQKFVDPLKLVLIA